MTAMSTMADGPAPEARARGAAGRPGGKGNNCVIAAPRAMKARFTGTCPECGGEIKAGKEILKNSQEKWVHKACSDLQEEMP